MGLSKLHSGLVNSVQLPQIKALLDVCLFEAAIITVSQLAYARPQRRGSHERPQKHRLFSVKEALHLLSTGVGSEGKFLSFEPVKSEQIGYLRSVFLLDADTLPKHCAHPVYKRPI